MILKVGFILSACWLSFVQWPSSVDDLGLGGASFLKNFIFYENCTGERLDIELAVPENRRKRRPISVSAVPVGPGM